MRRLAAFVFAALLVAAALPAHAFQKTSFTDGSFEYFFAAPSLDIRGSGDLDLTGLSFIEGVAGGFRVGASFDLDWMGGEQAVLASPASTWSGLDGLPRSLSISAAGSVGFDGTRLILPGGTITLMADGTLNVGNLTVVTAGGSGAAVGGSGLIIFGGPGIAVPPAPTFIGATLVAWVPRDEISFMQPPPATGVLNRVTGSDYSVLHPPLMSGGRIVPITLGGTFLIEPGGAITLVSPSPIPEPGTAALLLAGLLGLAGVVSRRARAGR